MLSQLIPFLFLCLSTGTFAVVDSDACLGGTDWKVAANNECSIESFKEALKPRFDKRCKRFGLSLDEDLQLLLGASSEKEARGEIEDICADAIGERHPKKIEFSSISNKAKGFDAAFFDGGTSWNEGMNCGSSTKVPSGAAVPGGSRCMTGNQKGGLSTGQTIRQL